MSLQLDRITFHYGPGGQGVDEISLDIAEGQLLAVIGPSGSGKSTLLRLVAGLVTQQSGRVVLAGRDLAGVPVHRRNIGVVFQSYALFPHLSVRDNVAYGLKMRDVAPAEREVIADRMLATVGLGEFAQRSPARLSGGQQQRVALARALAFGPKALLLDEPLAALDAATRGHLRDEIRQLQRQFGATTMLVTHDQEEALTMADRVAVLDGGRLLQLDTPERLYEAPAHSKVARFVGLSTLLPCTVHERGRIDLGFAILAADTGTRARGASAIAMVRPERVRADPPKGTANRIEGRTTFTRYLGSTVRYDFTPQGQSTAWLGEGHAVPREAIAVAPEHIRLLDQ
jgi:putative spermidine/putrescine transport system ATP-binding protein